MEQKTVTDPVKIRLNRGNDYRVRLDRFPVGETIVLDFEGEPLELVLRTSESERWGTLVSVIRVPGGIKDKFYEIFQGYVFVRHSKGDSILRKRDKDYAQINEWMEENGF